MAHGNMRPQEQLHDSHLMRTRHGRFSLEDLTYSLTHLAGSIAILMRQTDRVPPVLGELPSRPKARSRARDAAGKRPNATKSPTKIPRPP
jgi:hypothetical protein